MGVPPAQKIQQNRQDACSTKSEIRGSTKSEILVGWASRPLKKYNLTGKMPVPQRVKFGVPQRVKFLWGGRPARPKNTT
ncbi:hypothetical protein D0A37_21585 [Microcoleus vaginatus HSN003]|nr:hypothetical protein D0A37_21585 [Microcoleus vaginatus HSN003]